MRAVHLGSLVLALGMLAPATALAQRRPAATTEAQDRARAKAQEGLTLYEAGDLPGAYASFREADAFHHVPSITIYLARCQARLGRLLDARQTYQRILAEDLAPGAPAAFVTAHLDAGKELAALDPRVPWVRVLVTGAPLATPRVTLDGALLDDRRDADPGSHTIQVTADGEAPLTRTVTLREGQHETVTLSFAPHPAPVLPAPDPASSPSRAPAFIAFGVGGAGAVLGAVFGGLALAQAADIRSRCPSKACPSEKASYDAATTKAWVSNVGIGVAVAGVATGVVLLLVGAPRAAQAVQSAMGPGGVTVRF